MVPVVARRSTSIVRLDPWLTGDRRLAAAVTLGLVETAAVSAAREIVFELSTVSRNSPDFVATNFGEPNVFVLARTQY